MNSKRLLKSIEGRIFLSLIIIGIIPLTISYILNNKNISESLVKLEKENIQYLGNQTKMIMEEKLNTLEAIARDYAVWDDAYEAVESNDKKWLEENFSGWLPNNYDIDLSVVVNTNGEVIDQFGLKNNKVSQLLEVKIISDLLKSYNKASGEREGKGLMMYNGEPYLFCVSPILKNDYKGEARGVYIIGKRISAAYIQEIEARLGQKMLVTFGEKVVHSNSVDERLEEYLKSNKLLKDTSSVEFIDNKLMGYVNLDNLGNLQSGKVIVIMNRETFLNAKQNINLSSSLVMIGALIGIIAISVLLKEKTISPLKNIENQIYKMSEYSVISYVETDGPEEVEKLMIAFNNMVNKINEQRTENESLKAELEYDKLRSEFLVNVSHEFRTPLNVLLGTIQLMELYSRKEAKEKLLVDESKHLKVMKQNCYRLIRLVNNLIDLTRIQSGNLNNNLKNCNIVNLVEDITLSVAGYAENMGIIIGFDTDTEEKLLACDPDHIERIILNLLSNAIKFSKAGGEVWVNIKDMDRKVIISVKDNGIGIPKEQQDSIFERFSQVDRSLTRNHEGSGIGLSLVKALVEMHEGKIRVESDYGKGSEFIIELPVNLLQNSTGSETDARVSTYDKVEKIQVEFSDIYL